MAPAFPGTETVSTVMTISALRPSHPAMGEMLKSKAYCLHFSITDHTVQIEEIWTRMWRNASNTIMGRYGSASIAFNPKRLGMCARVMRVPTLLLSTGLPGWQLTIILSCRARAGQRAKTFLRTAANGASP